MLNQTENAGIILQTITPETAASWLKINTRNRRVSADLVNGYARAMQEGRWDTNGETIKISDRGRLLDGQHRLLACVKAQCNFRSYVIFGVNDDMFATIDVGKKRTAGDIIGLDDIKNADTVAAAVRWVVLLRSGSFKKANVKMAADEIRLFLMGEPDIETSAAEARKAHTVVAPAIAGALHYLFSIKDRETADAFMRDLAMGSNLIPGDPILVLRERLIRDKISKARLPQEEIMALCIRAWNRRRQRTTGTVVLKGATLGPDGKRSYPEIL